MINDLTLQKEKDKLTVEESNKIQEIKQAVDNDNTLTIRQKLFVKNYIDNWGNGSEAVRQSYNLGRLWGVPTKDKPYRTWWVESSIAAENLAKPSVKKYLDDFSDLAGSRIVHIMNNWKEDNQLKAAIFTYEQVHGKATQKVEKNTTFSLLWLSQDSFDAWKVIDTYIIEDNTQEIQELPDTIDNY